MGSKSIGATVSTVSATDLGHLEHATPRNLITLLQSSFFKAEFEQVARILSFREESTRQELARLEARKVRFESKCSTLESETEFLKARNLELQGQLKGGVRVSGSTIADLDRSLREGREKFAVLGRKHGERKRALREEREKVADLDRKHRNLEGTLREEANKVVNFEIKHGELETALREEREKVTSLESKHIELEGALREERKEVADLERKHRDLEDALRGEKQKVTALDRKHGELEMALREERKKVTGLESKHAELEGALREERAVNGCDEWKRKYGKLEATCLHMIDENLGITKRFKSTGEEKKLMHVDPKPEIVEISDSDDESGNGVQGLVGHYKWGTPHIKSEIPCEVIQEEIQFPQRKRNNSDVRKYVRQERFFSSSTSTMRVLTRCIMNDIEDEDDKIPLES